MATADNARTERPSTALARTAAARPWLAGLAGLLLVAAAFLPAVPAAADHDDAGSDPYYGGGDAYSGASYDTSYGGNSYGTYEDGEPADYDSGYSYVRNLRGDATLIQADGERDPLAVNQPILVGDRVWVAPGSMAEILLSDGNLLRIDADSEVSFDALAGSPEARDRSTALRLLEGNVQLLVFEDALGAELPRVDLPNASFHVATPGRFRLTSDRGDWAQIVARRGRGDVATPGGTAEVRAGFEVLVEGRRAPRVVHRQAGGYDLLERWGERLDRQVDDSGYVDDSLRYAAAPLADHGSWVTVGSSRAWRPQVTNDWYPYTHGRWRHTSIGLTWVSYEPWGWVPYHYGTWDHVNGFGWVWFPGRTFSPARVHWYWGPTHVAWVPSGYYTRHYGFRTRYGVYGWAGGSWDPFDRWVFCPTRYFGHRYQGRYAHSGRYWKRHHRGVLPRGIVTTDTRRLTRDRWHEPEDAIRALRTRPGVRDARDTRGVATRGDRGHLADLPDVTPFIARTDGGDLPAEVRRRVLAVDDGGRGEGIRTRGAAPGDRPSRSIQVDGGGDRSGGEGGVIRRSPPRAGSQPRALPEGGMRAGAPGSEPRAGSPGARVRGNPAAEGGDRVRGTRPSAEPRRRGEGAPAGRVEGRRGQAPTSRPVVRARPDRNGADDASEDGGDTTRVRGERDRGDRGDRGSGGAVGRSPRFRTGGGLEARTPRRSAPPSATPRATTPRATSPRGTTVRGTTPRSAAPRTATPLPRAPHGASPRASTPRTSTPRASTPRPSTPRASSPRASSPRAQSPRVTSPRATSPRATSPRATSPRATSPRGTSPRATPPRVSSPRATPPTRPAPRRDRAGTDRRPPAQRVLQGVRGSARSDSRATPKRSPQRRSPGATSRSAPTRRPSARSVPSRGSQRPSASSPSSSRSRQPAAKRSSSSSSGGSGKAGRSRGKRSDDNR